MLRVFCSLFLFSLVSFLPALAQDRDRFQTNRDIRIEEGESARDLTCLNCSIYIRGEVTGDIAALHGNVVLAEGAKVRGDIASILGDVRLEENASVGGDVAAVAGQVKRQPHSEVHGDVASLGGGGWMTLIFVIPLMVLGAIIALIVWLVQRSRRPSPVTA